jgi:hypothetical protein
MNLKDSFEPKTKKKTGANARPSWGRKKEPEFDGIAEPKTVDACAEFRSEYNAIATKIGLRPLTALTDNRRRIIGQLVNMPPAIAERLGIASWRDIVSRLARTKFPTAWGWTPEFGHLMTEDRLAELFEGRFDDSKLGDLEKGKRERWGRVMDLYVKTRGIRWPDDLGPRPGAEGCRAPADLLAAYASDLVQIPVRSSHAAMESANVRGSGEVGRNG